MMSRNTDIDRLWELIAAKIESHVPQYLQNILTLRGYDNVISLKRIKSNDINEMQSYIKSPEMKQRISVSGNYEDYYGPTYSGSNDKCYILPGHVYLLEEVVLFINVNLAAKGTDFFNVKSKQIIQGKTPNKTPSIVWNHSESAHISNVNIHKPPITLSSADEVESRIERRNIELSEDTVQTEMLELSPMDQRQSDKETETENHTNTMNTAANGDTRDLLIDSRTERDQEGFAPTERGPSTDTGDDDIPTNVNFPKEIDNLFAKVRLWFKKNVRSLFEQYSHKLTIKMVERADDAAITGKTSKVSLIIRCPVCDHAATASFVPAVGNKIGYFSPSNFERHVRRCHISSPRDTLPTKRAKKIDTQQKSNKLRGGKRKKHKNQQKDESETSDSDNGQTAKELSNNYVHESDDLADDNLEDESNSDRDDVMEEIQPRKSILPIKSAQPSTSTLPKRQLRSRDTQTDMTPDSVTKMTLDLLLKENQELKNTLRELQSQAKCSSDQNCTDCTESSDGFPIVRSLFDAARRNLQRKPAGYRHNNVVKAFAGYLKMIAGKLAYETLHANLPTCWPSPTTANRFIKGNSPAIIEGQLRCEELLSYLQERNLPLRVSLSEDATRIIGTVTYDPTTNQLVGFALPTNSDGMPIPFSFMARNAKEIQQHFNANETSSNVYVQMAQPVSRSVPAFCLLLFLTDQRFVAETVLSRWNYSRNELWQTGIIVDNYASDGDSRLTKVMKFRSEIGVTDLDFFNCEWFSCGNSGTTYTQDIIHVGTKARNRILKASRRTPIGQKIITVSHLLYLIQTVSKDKHFANGKRYQPEGSAKFPIGGKNMFGKSHSMVGLLSPWK